MHAPNLLGNGMEHFYKPNKPLSVLILNNIMLQKPEKTNTNLNNQHTLDVLVINQHQVDAQIQKIKFSKLNVKTGN